MEMANIVMEVSVFFSSFFFFLVNFQSVYPGFAHAIYVHKVRYDTAAFKFCDSFQHYYFSFLFRNGKKNVIEIRMCL